MFEKGILQLRSTFCRGTCIHFRKFSTDETQNLTATTVRPAWVSFLLNRYSQIRLVLKWTNSVQISVKKKQTYLLLRQAINLNYSKNKNAEKVSWFSQLSVVVIRSSYPLNSSIACWILSQILNKLIRKLCINISATKHKPA